MYQAIQIKDKLVAALYPINEITKSNATIWFGTPNESLQGSRMYYDKGKTFKTHKHILNPRIINRTQESFVVIRGKIQIDIYLNKDGILGKEIEHIGSLVAGAGDAIFVWGEYHKLSILEDDTVCYEIKAGSFTCVEDDKEFIDV
jgi:hypothetical protein